jgi:uncharacterized protein YdaU (DUF1376 family)
MAKDPAFLFYSSDFMMGTSLMSEAEVGQYIRILCHMHQSGHLTFEDMNNICHNISSKVVAKFKQDENGLFFNERLDAEVQKRKNYSESRRKNRLQNKKESYDYTYVPPVSTHMENENRNDNGIELKLKESLNEIYIDQQRPKWGHIDFDFELNSFLEKVRGSPDDYLTRDNSGIKLAFQYQLRNAKPKGKNGKPTDKATEHANSLLEGFKRRNG